ncbi:hypothetical protein ABIE45_003875 [Methylobacterium sp. OAE515]
MTASQRTALLRMCRSILACDCAPPDIRFRARSLENHLVVDGWLHGIFG